MQLLEYVCFLLVSQKLNLVSRFSSYGVKHETRFLVGDDSEKFDTINFANEGDYIN